MANTTKTILELDIKTEAAQKHVNDLNTSIEKNNELTKKSLKENGKESEAYKKQTKELARLKTAQKDATKVLREQDRERNKAVKAMEKQRSKWQDIIKAARLEARTNDEIRQKLNAMIAIRDKTAIRGTAAYNKQTIAIQKLDKAVKSNNASIGRHQGNVGKYPKVTAAAVAAAGALIMAFKQLSRMAKQSIDLFLQQDDMNVKVGNTFGAFADEINNAANATQKLTTIGNEQYQKLAILASNMGIANGKVNATVQESIGLAELYADAGLGQETAIKSLALARQGDFTMLQRYVPAIKEANTEAEKTAILNDIVAKGYLRTQENVESYKGRITQLKNSYGDLQEVVGGQVLGGLFDPKEGGDMIDTIDGIIQALEETQFIGVMMENMSKSGKQFGDIIQKIGKIFGVTIDSGSALTGIFTFLTKTFELTTIPLRVLLSVVEVAIDNFSNFYNILSDLENASFEDVFDIIKTSIATIIEPITDLLGLTGELNKMLGIVGDTATTTTNHLEDLNNMLLDPLGAGKKYIEEQEAIAEATNKITEATDAENKAIEDAQKNYEALTNTLRTLNDEYQYQIYFSKTAKDEEAARLEQAKKTFDAYKTFFAEGGYTGAELQKLEELREAIFNFDEEMLARVENNVQGIFPTEDELKKQVEDVEKAINDVMNLRVKDNEMQAKESKDLTKEQQKEWEERAAITASFAEQMGNIVASSIDENGLNLQKFGAQFSIFILDILEKQVMASVVSATAQSFAQPDSVATGGATGAIRAGILAGLIKGAFSVVKGIISSTTKGFADGGDTGAGGKYEPAGIVHKGENVFSQEDIKQLGGMQIVESMRPTSATYGQYFNGGAVGYGATGISALPSEVNNDRPIVVTVEDINAGLLRENKRISIANQI